MIVLFDKNTTSFNDLGIGILRDFKSEPIITEVLNGLFNLEFDYVRNGWLSEDLVEGNLIKANEQIFRIWHIKKNIDETKITILAKHIFFDLEKSNFLEDVAPTNKTGQEAIGWILEHAIEPSKFSVTGDCTKLATARYVRVNPIDAIYNADNCILNRFGGEIELNNYNINLHNKRGSDLGLEIRQKKNLNGANYEVDLSTVATRIMPIGKDGILLPEKYIDSPLINNYFAPFFYKYEVDIGVDEENTLEDCYSQMRQAVQDLYTGGIDKPTVSISINFIELSKTKEYEIYSNLEKAHLGDSCKVYIPSLNINLTTRIVKTVYNCSKKRITQVELGTPKPNYVTSKIDTETALKNAVSFDNPTSILQQAKENATNLIKHPFKGYLYISEETGEFYLMDTTDINTAQSVWKFGLGGIGYSSTGINGTYGIAITQDGKIVADYITAGQMSIERISGLTNTLDDMQANITLNKDNITFVTQSINDDYYTKETVESLILNSEAGLTNMFTNSGGNNLLRNSAPWYMTSETTGEFWNGNIKQIVEPKAVSGYAILTQSGTASQSVVLANGDYSVSFKYKRLIAGATCSVRYNGKTFNLTNSEGEIHSTGEVTTGQFVLEIIATSNNGFEVYDLMLKHGTEGAENMLVWTQNANESRSDTVQISQGITAISSTTDTKSTMDSDGFKVRNKTSGVSIMEATATGGLFRDLTSTGESNLSGLLIKKSNGTIKINGESGS